MLFGKRGKSGLVALNLDLAEVASFVKERLGKEVIKILRDLSFVVILLQGEHVIYFIKQTLYILGHFSTYISYNLILCLHVFSHLKVEMGGCKGPITTFIVEPFVPHNEEFYLNIVSERLGCSVSFSECGGIDIEENWDKVCEMCPSFYKSTEDMLKFKSVLYIFILI